jgi:opacity protein-like surface antigen
MRKLLVLFGVCLCLSLTAAAQEAPAAVSGDSASSEPAPSPTFQPSQRQPWQLGVGYQYQHFSALGQSFSTNGFNSDITRYLNNWIGVEGTAVMGFGNTGAPRNLDAKSFFVGGGAHVAVQNKSRLEPWAHVLVGWEHFRFTQTTTIGSNSALGFMGGGGVDIKLTERAFWRVQGDYIGTHFQSAMQTNYSFGTGLVFNF